jgi:hypothetical protein
MTDDEGVVLTVDGKGRAAKRAALVRLVNEIAEECAQIAEEGRQSTPEEARYGRFIAARIRAELISR